MPAESKQLAILKALTVHLEGATTVAGVSMIGRVFRGRMVFGAEMPLPSMSILEAPRPDDGFTAGEEQVKRSEEWVLLLQGWADDRGPHPTDAAYDLKATVEERLSDIVAVDAGGLPVFPETYLLGGRITKLVVSPGIVRPADTQISAKAFFYLPIRLGLVVDIRTPFVGYGSSFTAKQRIVRMAQNQTLGRGRLLFGRFPSSVFTENVTLQYLGNTPSFAVSQALTTLDHYDSDQGLKIKDMSVTISADMSAKFTCDDISVNNLALWYLGQTGVGGTAAATGVSETATATLGGFIQLGVTDANPGGARNVTTVAITNGAAVTEAGNYTVDLAAGLISIDPAATDIADGDVLTITYNTVLETTSTIIPQGSEVFGRLFFQSLNPVGTRRNHLYRYCKLSPDGDYNLKGDDWQTLNFNVEILSPPTGPRYIIG